MKRPLNFVSRLCLGAGLVIAAQPQAADTELYNSVLAAGFDGKPQVLVIFDNSASMADTKEIAAGFDPNDPDIVPWNQENSQKPGIWWSRGSLDNVNRVPETHTDSRRFNMENNNCQSAVKALETVGYYTGYIREFVNNSWVEVRNNNGLNIDAVDCFDDIENAMAVGPDNNYSGFSVNPGYNAIDNGMDNFPNGFPVSGNKQSANNFYTSTPENAIADMSESEWKSVEPITLYSAKYLAWYQMAISDTLPDGSGNTATKLAVAKKAMTDLVDSAGHLMNMGMMIYNEVEFTDNQGIKRHDGGRIIAGIGSSQAATVTAVQAISPNADTPLCETLYEAYRYFAGKEVYFATSNNSAKPARDRTIETIVDADGATIPATYMSPIAHACSGEAHIILITDGIPEYDDAADEMPELAALPYTKFTGEKDGAVVEGQSKLPALVKMLADGIEVNGQKRSVTTHIVSFGEDIESYAGQLMNETNNQGPGKYIAATNVTELNDALQNVLWAVLEKANSFTAPTIAANNFDKTRSLNSVYYAMFQPNADDLWTGNLKKFVINNEGNIVDALGNIAIDTDGDIKSDAQSFWSSAPDGRKIDQGGVAEVLGQISRPRVVLSNIGPNGELVDVTDTQSSTTYQLGVAMGILNEGQQPTLDQLLLIRNNAEWLYGKDVDDEDGNGVTAERRSGLFGDPLHSRPLAITYDWADDDRDIGLVVGTNAGYLHMFTDSFPGIDDASAESAVYENWAFVPKQLIMTAMARRTSTGHSYGMDAPPVYYEVEDGSGNTRRMVVTGMRRGGSSYFALDVTAPDTPALAWQINAGDAGFEGLGQTWSTPRVIELQHNKGGAEQITKALLFGGGYDTNKDLNDCIVVETGDCMDTVGRGVYLVDASDGSLIHAFDSFSCVNSELNCLKHSVASQVTPLDSNTDGLVDRIYFGDTGGNIWRADMPSADISQWSLVRLATLGSEDTSNFFGTSFDRRFFAPATVVQSFYEKLEIESDGTVIRRRYPFDGVLIGAGDRTRPASDLLNKNYFFMLRDEEIFAKSFDSGSTDTTLQPPTPITLDMLKEVSFDPMGNASTEADYNREMKDLSDSRGWRFDLTGTGEKSLGGATVLGGTVYFTSFIPNPINAEYCVAPGIGGGNLYAINLHTTESVYTWRKKDLGERVPDSLVVHSGEDENGESTLRVLLPGVVEEQLADDEDPGCLKANYGSLSTCSDLMPRKMYSYFQEY